MGSRRFGFECELVSGARSVIASLHEAGVANTDDLHGYHCSCNDCRPNDVEASGGPLFRGQRDCTVDGEIISSILTHGTDNADRAFSVLSGTLLATRAGVDTNAGFHVHVDKRDLTTPDKLRLYRMFLRYQNNDLAELAAAKEHSVRGYNYPITVQRIAPSPGDRGDGFFWEGNFYSSFRRPEPPVTCNDAAWSSDSSCCGYCDSERFYFANLHSRNQRAAAEWDRRYGPDAVSVREPYPEERFWTDDTFVPTDPPKGQWLNGNGAGDGNQTIEFRLWNATRVEWRMRLAVGVSVAMVDAAKAGVNVTENDERPLEEVLADHLSDDTWAGILRQRSFKD